MAYFLVNGSHSFSIFMRDKFCFTTTLLIPIEIMPLHLKHGKTSADTTPGAHTAQELFPSLQ
jgi:hypothetical protein